MIAMIRDGEILAGMLKYLFIVSITAIKYRNTLICLENIQIFYCPIKMNSNNRVKRASIIDQSKSETHFVARKKAIIPNAC